jgi:hypothetical protein
MNSVCAVPCVPERDPPFYAPILYPAPPDPALLMNAGACCSTRPCVTRTLPRSRLQITTTCGVPSTLPAVGTLVDGSCDAAVFGTLGHVVVLDPTMTGTQSTLAYVT